MSAPVSTERWRQAQLAEREYWNWPVVDARELSRILLGLSEAAVWAKERLPPRTLANEWVEVGIGPLGLGCGHFVNTAESHQLVGVDPLPLIPTEELSLPPPLIALIESCRRNYHHVVAPGESTGLQRERFGLAILHNMLDHVRDPLGVLVETRRVLRPDGIMFLVCDTFSLLGQARFTAVTKFRQRDSWLVRAHPFRFRFTQLLALVKRAEFRVVTHEPARGLPLYEVARGSYRSMILAKRA
jgi:SAM-dependent methyltransferase